MKRLPTFNDLVERFPALQSVLGGGRLRRLPFVQQLTQTECGVACLAMTLRYFGKYVALDTLRDIAVSGRDATNAQKLVETARLYGLQARAVSLDLDQLQYLERGTILHWEFRHFVVFDRLTRNAVDILDPAQGRRRVPLDAFGKSFTGVAILLEPGPNFESTDKPSEPIATYWREILRERTFLAHVVVTSLLIQTFALGFPLLSRFLVDQLIPNRDFDLLTLVAIAIAFVMVFQTAAAILRQYALLYLRIRLDSRMTLAFLDHLLALPFEFFQRRSAGDLMVRLSSNSTVRDILTGTALSTLLDGSFAIGYLVLLLLVSPLIAGVTLAVGLIQVALAFITRRQQRGLIAAGMDAEAKSKGYLMEALAGIEVLKSLGAEQRAMEHWSSLFVAELNNAIKRGKLDAVLDSINGGLRNGSTLGLMVLGASLVLRNEISVGDMLAVVALATAFLTPLMSLVGSGTRLQLLVVYLERLNDVLDTPVERNSASGLHPGTLTGAVALSGVSYRYGPISPLVVRNVSLAIEPGQFVAIVGRSGSGKSTLARILVGLYDPTEGSLLYDGKDLKNLDLRSVRSQIGVVTQQSQLFGGTIWSNIALADATAGRDRVVSVAQQAAIHNDIMAMPMGYDTSVADRGSSISGGQQQRLAIARALLAAPRLLVFDEATSQLDTQTEAEVYANLSRMGCTRIVIAHRLSTIVHADRIVVMEAGEIVESGTHDELLALRGVYAALVSAQRSTTAEAGPVRR
jgi:ATP-binding cassette subfamily B protein